MFSSFSQIIKNRYERKEQGIALYFALIIMFLCLTVAALLATFVLSAVASSRQLNYQMAFQAASETAVNQALQVANSPEAGETFLETHQTESNAVTGQLNNASTTYPVRWRWYSQKVVRSGGNVEWYIFVDAYTNSPSETNARHIRATFVGLNVSGATYSGGTIRYTLGTSSVFEYGLFANSNATFADNTQIWSYDSQTNTAPGTNGNNSQVAANGTLTLGANTGLAVFNQMGDSAKCTPAANCANVQVTNQGFQYSLDSVTTAVTTACPNSGTYAAWNASSGTALVNGGCYSSLNFDANVSIGTATKVYDLGNVTVGAGVQVNYNGRPQNLQILSTGSTATFTNGSISAPTYFNGLVSGAGLACADSTSSTDTSATLKFYGNMACSTLNFHAPTKIWMDDSTRTLTASASSRWVYNLRNIQVNSAVG